MKALVLSGGKGTRLRPITYTSAKQLLPVANKPILFYGLEAIRAAGIRDVGIVVGDTRQEIEQAVGDGSAFGLRVSYIHQPEPLGLAHAVKIAQDYLGEEDFVMYLGDNLIIGGITSLVDEFRANKPNCQILLARVRNPQQFGVAEISNGRVVSLEEKPKQPKSDLALVGVYMFDSHIFEAVNNIKPSWRNELEITDAIQYLVEHGYEVHPHLISGWWKDTGKLEDILEANRMLLDGLQAEVQSALVRSSAEGRVRIQPDCVIEDSLIRGPTIIGEGCTLSNAYVGPYTSISPRVTLSHCEVEHSIILPDAKISGIRHRIVDSLLGRNVVIEAAEQRPTAHRFMLGDNSAVRLG